MLSIPGRPSLHFASYGSFTIDLASRSALGAEPLPNAKNFSKASRFQAFGALQSYFQTPIRRVLPMTAPNFLQELGSW